MRRRRHRRSFNRHTREHPADRKRADDILNPQSALTLNLIANSRGDPLPASHASSNFRQRSSLYARAISTTSHLHDDPQKLKLYIDEDSALRSEPAA